MGHSYQAVSVLTRAGRSVFSVPLAMRIHEGIVHSNRDKRTLLDKMIALLAILNVTQSFYFVHVGIVSQGLLQYLASCHTELVWKSFGSWLRTIRPGIVPSELVVATALRHCLPEILLVNSKNSELAKFITERQDLDRMAVFRLVS